MKKYFPSSELIINEDGSVFHLHVKPEQLADKVILHSLINKHLSLAQSEASVLSFK